MNIDLMKQELTRDEGIKLLPYADTVGKMTIGVGRNLDDVGISKDEAEYMLENDINRTIADLDRNLPWWVQLDEVRQRVMVNMAFNMGIKTLLTFKNTLALIDAGKYDDAASAMLQSKWASQVKDRAVRLSQMMKTGEA